MNNYVCPIEKNEDEMITLAHGDGGKIADKLLEDIFIPAFSNAKLNLRHDGAFIQCASQKIAMSTDSYVIRPLFFEGGDIGKLSVYGTTNDLIMCGATPKYLSCSFILSEGLPLNVLKQVVQSMSLAAKECQIDIVTGDTKVIEHHHPPELIINTTGIGFVDKHEYKPNQIDMDDCIIVSGDIGKHGLAILMQREGIELNPPLSSDCASLLPSYKALQLFPIHCMRDLTRGGLAACLNELSSTCGKGFTIEENKIPISQSVQSASELLGLNPLHIACEGRFILFAPQAYAQDILQTLNRLEAGHQAVMIGKVTSNTPQVILNSRYGVKQKLSKITSSQLPRIC